MRRVLVALVGLGLASCFGFDDRLEACRNGLGVCAVDAGPSLDAGTEADAGCALIAGDLLVNGSFERSTFGVTQGWTGTPSPTRRDGGAAVCQSWVEQTSTTQNLEFYGDFDLPAAAPARTAFLISGFVKSLDGDTQPLVIQLRARSAGYTAKRTAPLAADGTWTPVSVVLELANTSSQLGVEVLSEAPRSVGYDGFSVLRQ